MSSRSSEERRHGLPDIDHWKPGWFCARYDRLPRDLLLARNAKLLAWRGSWMHVWVTFVPTRGDNMNKYFKTLVALAGLAFLVACNALVAAAPGEIRPGVHARLQPGDRIADMSLGTEAEQAYPLWSYCSTPTVQGSITTVDCEVPAVSRLAIGYPFEAAGRALDGLDWSELVWDLSLDQTTIDLYAFGTHDLVYPGLADHPSHIREVFRKIEVWDVVLEDLTPGAHTLRGSVQAGGRTYIWVVNLQVGAEGM
jgi:hypothetical protein